MPTIGGPVALVALNDAAAIDCFDAGTVGFNIVTSADWNGTLSFEGSADATNFRSMNCFSLGSGIFARTHSTANDGSTWVLPCGGLRKARVRVSTFVAGTATVTPAASGMTEWGIQIYPVLTTAGLTAQAHGASPTAVASGARQSWFGNRDGIPFMMGGHPNLQSYAANFTGAQTDTALVTISTGSIIVVTGFLITCHNANSVNVSARLGFGVAVVPAYGSNGIIGSHPGIAAGSGFGRGGGAGIIGFGADNEDLRFTCGAPTGGSIDCNVSYFTIAS